MTEITAVAGGVSCFLIGGGVSRNRLNAAVQNNGSLSDEDNITPVDKYPGSVIPAQAGIQQSTGCPRITMRDKLLRSGMTALAI
ncbi:MAG: hypothetical protein P8X85_08360 [Desulfobacterales bacterium]